MSVEFFCPHCEAYLRAPAAKLGLSISCPYCHGRLWVPLESEEWETDSTAWDEYDFVQTPERTRSDPQVVDAVAGAARRGLASTLGKQKTCRRCQRTMLEEDDVCPVCGDSSISNATVTEGGEDHEVDVSLILAVTWEIYTTNFWPCFSVTLADTVLTTVATVVALFVGAFAATQAAQGPASAFLAFFVAAGIGWSVAMAMFAVGHIRYYLDLCRTGQPEFAKAINFEGPVGAMLGGGLVFWSLFLLILPPIFLWPYGRVVVDKNSSALSGLRTALSLSFRNTGVCFVLFVVKIGVVLVSGLVPIVGTLFLTPYLAILNTVAYLYMSGEWK